MCHSVWFQLPTLFSVPSESVIHPPAQGPTDPCSESKHAAKIHQVVEEDKVIRRTCSPFLGITPAAFLDGSLACRKPIIGRNIQWYQVCHDHARNCAIGLLVI